MSETEEQEHGETHEEGAGGDTDAHDGHLPGGTDGEAIGDMGPLGELDPLSNVDGEMVEGEAQRGIEMQGMDGIEGMEGMEGMEVEGFDEGHMASILEMGTG